MDDDDRQRLVAEALDAAGFKAPEEMERVADPHKAVVMHAYEGMPTEAARRRFAEMAKLLEESIREGSIGGRGEAEE